MQVTAKEKIVYSITLDLSQEEVSKLMGLIQNPSSDDEHVITQNIRATMFDALKPLCIAPS